jgi:hypothetical protein
MKYHSIFTPALTSLCLLVTTASLASDGTVQPIKEPARWFEIEVILFKQISNKDQNKEQFSSRDLTAKKRNALDLLTPYLQPNITALKQLLPTCGQQSTTFPYGIKTQIFNIDDTNDSIPATALGLANETISSTTAKATKTTKDVINYNSANNTDNTLVNKVARGLENSATDKEKNNTPSMSVTVLPSAPEPDVVTDLTSALSTKSGEHEHQMQYANVVLPNYNQYPSDSQTPLCIIPAEIFQQNLNSAQLTQFNIDGFPVEKLTNAINGIEQWRDDENGEITWASDKPYLISQDSFKLKSIANRIKRSRNYAPLLHLGWRQIGETKRKAQAMTIYAGEHLSLNHQQALAKQAEQQTALAIEAIVEKRLQAELLTVNQQVVDSSTKNDTDNIIDNNVAPESALTSQSSAIEKQVPDLNTLDEINTVAIPLNELSIEEELRQQAKQQQLDNLFQQFAQLSTNSTELIKAVNDTQMNEEEIKQIVAQLSSDINKPVKTLFDDKDAQIKPVTLEAPLQAWSLDGLFKVHLDHYLYINSEFNLIEKKPVTSSVEQNSQGTKTLNEQQIISFKQDRRVISGEIHYFDHPHIGMVVQIRRFDPTKPADEAVSQSKK